MKKTTGSYFFLLAISIYFIHNALLAQGVQPPLTRVCSKKYNKQKSAQGRSTWDKAKESQVMFLVLKGTKHVASHVNTFVVLLYFITRNLSYSTSYDTTSCCKHWTSSTIAVSVVVFKQRKSHVYFVVAIVSFLFLIYFRKQYTKLSFATILKRRVAPITQIQRFVMVKNSSQHQTWTVSYNTNILRNEMS